MNRGPSMSVMGLAAAPLLCLLRPWPVKMIVADPVFLPFIWCLLPMNGFMVKVRLNMALLCWSYPIGTRVRPFVDRPRGILFHEKTLLNHGLGILMDSCVYYVFIYGQSEKRALKRRKYARLQFGSWFCLGTGLS